MANTISVDSKVQGMLGTLMLQNAQLQTQLELAQLRIQELEAVVAAGVSSSPPSPKKLKASRQQ